jgi:hypothetical protein
MVGLILAQSARNTSSKGDIMDIGTARRVAKHYISWFEQSMPINASDVIYNRNDYIVSYTDKQYKQHTALGYVADMSMDRLPYRDATHVITAAEILLYTDSQL